MLFTEDDKQWISERLEKVETTRPTEVHKWASPVELRQRSHAAALRALGAEVESLSDRLNNLEGRGSTPSPLPFSRTCKAIRASAHFAISGLRRSIMILERRKYGLATACIGGGQGLR